MSTAVDSLLRCFRPEAPRAQGLHLCASCGHIVDSQALHVSTEWTAFGATPCGTSTRGWTAEDSACLLPVAVETSDAAWSRRRVSGL